jgi:hypothetical protein
MKPKMTVINFFWKAYKKIRPFNKYEASLEVPVELLNGIETNPLEVLERILRYGLEQRVIGKGCYIAGVYQVQTSEGVFSRKDDKEVRLIDWNKGCSEKLVKFETYEEAFEEIEESEQPIEKDPTPIKEDGKRDSIFLQDLKMWAKFSYPKFQTALDRYDRLVQDGKSEVNIFWNQDGSISVEKNESRIYEVA